MTNGSGKPPFDPFGQGERTVIKPNPGGRRDTPAGGADPARPRTSQPADDVWGGSRDIPQSTQTGGSYTPPQPQPFQPTLRPTPPPAAPAPRMPHLAVPDLGATAITSGPNPILDAARPILLLLSNVRIARQLPQVGPLMDTVVKGIDSFEASLRLKGIDDQQVTMAKYAVCATADDIVQNLPSTDKQLWTQYSMLSRYFQTRDSGVGFFDALTKLRTNPTINFDLLSLMHACLSLGFEGKYRVAGGDVPLQHIRRDLFETLRTLRARTVEDIAPHWRGQAIPAQYVRRAVPMWAVGSVALGLLLLSFMTFRWLLGGMADDASVKLAALHPQGDILLLRASFAPQEPVVVPETTQLERIRQALADDISQQRLSADYAGKDIVIRLLNDAVFDKGSASVRQGFLAAIGRMSQVLNKETGRIKVVGHTDNTPLRSSVKFKDNQDLSEQRAKAVALLMLPLMTDAKRLAIQGLADTAPIDTADTPEAKARNRRVEVFIPREDQ